MRLLVVGHTYLTAFSQRKYVAMKRLDPALQVRIVTPPEIGHVFMRYRHERHPALSQEETIAIPTIFGQTHMTYVLSPARLWTVLHQFIPDHIHIEEDSHSLAGVEAVSLARLACPDATISFFIWDNLARTPRFPLNVVKQAFTQYSLARATLVVCGNAEAESLLRKAKGYTGRTAVLPQVGLDLEDYATPPRAEIRAALSVVPGELWVGFVGRFVPEKGLIVLLEALSRLQHLRWRLLLVGDGPLRDDVETRWQSMLGSRLLFVSAVPHVAVPDYLKCLDIFVLPSYRTDAWKEQFGLTLAEAMMAGVACIGSSSGAIPEVIGGAGVVVQERDVGSLCQALERVISSETTRQGLKDKARSFALKHYTNSVVAARYLELFQSVTSPHVRSVKRDMDHESEGLQHSAQA